MIRILRAILPVAALAAVAIVPAAAQAAPAIRAAPAISCATGALFLSNDRGTTEYDSAISRVILTDLLHADQLCASDVNPPYQLIVSGYNNECYTYAGPRSGSGFLGYLDITTCRGVASQLWERYTNGLISNGYTGFNGVYCLEGAKYSGEPFMYGCNSGNPDQVWSYN